MNKGDLDEDKLKHTELYFSFAISCDIEPEDLLNRIRFEWGKMKGQRLQIKDLLSFASETPLLLYKLYNQGHWKSIIRELTMIMEKARNTTSRDDNLEEKHEARLIPPMKFHKNILKLPGQDTLRFNNWTWKVQVNQKVLHLEVDKGEIKFTEKIIEVAKENKFFE